jgi:hypothetical protein
MADLDPRNITMQGSVVWLDGRERLLGAGRPPR